MGIPRGKRVVGRASLGVEAIRDRHGLEQGRLTRPVLANENVTFESKASERSPSDASAEIRRRYSSPWTSSHRIETEDMNSSPSSMTPPIVRAPNAVIVRARQDKALRHDEVTEGFRHMRQFVGYSSDPFGSAFFSGGSTRFKMMPTSVEVAMRAGYSRPAGWRCRRSPCPHPG